jgi:hypothetical protein
MSATASTATTEGTARRAGARGWVEHRAGFAAPACEAVGRALGSRRGSSMRLSTRARDARLTGALLLSPVGF